MFSFDQILGNKILIQHLKSAINRGKISHAYIFQGQAGLGKKTLANTFAKTIQCTSGTDEPCNSCISCKTFETGNHPDIIYVTATKTKALGVTDIRQQINETVDIHPYYYPYKIYIIDKADTMTPAAQNALLKTIEEPPSYGIFLLLSARKESLLPTIISRCVPLVLTPLSPHQVEDHLKGKLELSPEEADFLSTYTQGNLGRAIALVQDEAFIDLKQRVTELAAKLTEKENDIASLLAVAKELEQYKESIQDALDILILWHRDLLVKKTAGSGFMWQKDRKTPTDTGRIDLKALLTRLEALFNAKEQLWQNGNFQLTMEIMLLKMYGWNEIIGV